jgi:hypothetical protein
MEYPDFCALVVVSSAKGALQEGNRHTMCDNRQIIRKLDDIHQLLRVHLETGYQWSLARTIDDIDRQTR